MQAHIQAAILDTTQASAEGRLHFGQVIARLVAAGVESYVADYRAQRTTYYLPNGQMLDVPLVMSGLAVADDFSVQALQAAIHGSQRGEVTYPVFKKLSCAAGCTGYTVWIAGRHVTYFGRRGETHVEWFPD